MARYTHTEVLLAAYVKWGEACLEKLRGMFAFAIWDRETSELFLARDRFGVKPLFYCEYGGAFFFASEMKGILRFPFIPRKLNARAIQVGRGVWFDNAPVDAVWSVADRSFGTVPMGYHPVVGEPDVRVSYVWVYLAKKEKWEKVK